MRPRVVWQRDGRGVGTPAVDADTVYFLTRTHEVVAIARTSGRVRWRSSLGIDAAATVGSRVVAAGDVVVAGGHDLIALGRGSGARRWAFAPEADHGFGFYLGNSRERVVYAGSASGVLVALHADSGKSAWTARLGGADTTVYAPVVDDSMVVAAFTDVGPGGARGLVCLDRASGRERWRVSLVGSGRGGSPPAVAGGPLLSGQTIIVSGHDGSLQAMARTTGAIVWSRPGVTDDPARVVDFRPLVLEDGVVAAGSLSGDVEGIDAVTGQRRWQTRPLLSSVAFTMAHGGGLVFVPYVSGGVVALRATTGAEVWRIGAEVASGARWAPAVSGADVYVAASLSGFFRLSADRRAEG